MKVKDLIELLKTLDQEKEIKIVYATGYEFEEEIVDEVNVRHYSDKVFEWIPYYHKDENGTDFYVIS